MEIGTFLRSRPRATLLAMLFPVLAALGAYLILSLQPARYTATATVSVPGSAADSASRVGIFVADFGALAVSTPVLEEISGSTGVSASEVRQGLEVARVGQSSIFTVAYTGDSEDTVEPVVRSVIDATFERLLPVAAADEALEQATQAAQDAEAERAQFEDEIGTIQPDRAYADVSNRIRDLQAARPLTPAQASELSTLQARQDELVAQIRQLEELDEAVDTANRVRADAQQAADAAHRDADASQNPDTIRDMVVEEAPRSTSVVPGVAVAAVAGLLVGIALLALPELLRRRRSPAAPYARRHRAPAQAPAQESLDPAGHAR
ncbi:hypothetical protein [Quadrisphaera sp. DSM 44207]|uniref:hypothetical protein n=1 Tax=Quadrisphaera sp. DSM 44207 TaxID=1881057 RepID=UPI0008844562|nr:hypothetical protein [Quadrisphaera sp. DSM 44207]SDQ67909.1 Chain length determinant protein [Quadrisphaera sp. DSM 44207]